MHNHTCTCGNHGEHEGHSHGEHHDGECCCGHVHTPPAPLAPAWSMLGKGPAAEASEPDSEFDFPWEGQSIHVYQWGNRENIPVVLLHGFMQTGMSWENLASRLSETHCVYALDFLGHGKSSKPHDASLYSFEAHVRMVEAFLEQVACVDAQGSKRRAHVIGYSKGGRVALGLASSDKDLLYSLVLESCNFGPANNEERIAARERNRAWAQQLRSAGIEKFVEYWEALPLFESQRERASTKCFALSVWPTTPKRWRCAWKARANTPCPILRKRMRLLPAPGFRLSTCGATTMRKPSR